MKKSLLKLSEEKLVMEISLKSRAGAEAMYDMYSGSLYGAILQIVRHKETAEDLLQLTFMKIWDAIDGYDIAKGRLFTWMVAIARNLAKDKLRSKAYHNGLITDDIEYHSQQIDRSFYVIFNNDVLFLKSLAGQLKKDQKDVIDLVYFKGYTQVEAAEELCIPLGTIKTRCRGAINALRNKFAPGLLNAS